ncbi:MAG: hypothetical protein ABI151_03485 [Chitinophagaceae bacterium]
MKNIFFLFAIFFFFRYAFAQQAPSRYQPVKTIKGDFIDFNIDNLGNIYAFNSENQLKKLNAKGDSLGVYNEVRRFGKVYSVDASNPLRVILFYRDFGTIVILDRFLNIRATINLRNLNIFQVRAVCQAYDNGIWVYDEQEAKLKKITEDGVVASQSGDFRIFMETVPMPATMTDQDKLVYLYDPDKGLFTFDYFGSLKNKVALKGWKDFQVIDGRAFGRKDNNIVQYMPGSLDLKEEPAPTLLAGIRKLQISRNYLYCLRNGMIEIYSIKND